MSHYSRITGEYYVNCLRSRRVCPQVFRGFHSKSTVAVPEVRAALHDAGACRHVCKPYVVSTSCQRTTLLHRQKRSRSTLYLTPYPRGSRGCRRYIQDPDAPFLSPVLERDAAGLSASGSQTVVLPRFSSQSAIFSGASFHVLHYGFVSRPRTNHKTSLKRGFAIASLIISAL